MSEEMQQVKRVYPSKRPLPGSCALSILDSVVSNYSISGAVWLYEANRSSSAVAVYTAEALETSLRHALSAYPEWCGSLHLVEYTRTEAAHDHTRRYGRVHLSWGHHDDPGVELTILTHVARMEDSLPAQLQQGAFNHSSVPSDVFTSSASLVDLRSPISGAPCMLVKISLFACGGVGIAIGLHHSLADAQGLATFMRDWATVHRQLIGDIPMCLPSRPLLPQALDQHASGNIDAATEDPDVREEALKLPRLALDFWASEEGKPSIITSPTRPDPAVAAQDVEMGVARGVPIPWASWEYEKPVKDHLFDFTPCQLAEIWQRATRSDPTLRLSRLDALLAHLWSAIVRARCLAPDEKSTMSISMGLRQRLGLEPTFRGSPIISLSASLPASVVTTDLTCTKAARAIRSSINSAAPPAISALLHHYAFALDPIREWHAFLGSHHLMVTSWLGIEGYEVDLGSGSPTFITSQMPKIDGLVVIMEQQGATAESSTPWYHKGARVRLFLQDEVMERVMADASFGPR